MLEQMVRSNLRSMTFSVRDHASLLKHNSALCESLFKSHDYCCHVCGVKVPDCLEVDHGSRHVPTEDISVLKPICQFCHNLKHPIWAASRGRLVAIHAPDISQVDLTRLSWAMVAWREAYPDVFEKIRSDILLRAKKFSDLMECNSAEGLFEAALAIVDEMGKEKALMTLKKVDQVLRFVPFEITVDIDDIGDLSIDQASRLSTWTIGGFKKFTKTASRNMLSSIDPEVFKRLHGSEEDHEEEKSDD